VPHRLNPPFFFTFFVFPQLLKQEFLLLLGCCGQTKIINFTLFLLKWDTSTGLSLKKLSLSEKLLPYLQLELVICQAHLGQT
jgi:hypothetical protein